MPKTAAQLDREIDECLFRIEMSDRARSSGTLRRRGYREALRAAAGELLGSGGDRARIYLGDDLVSEGALQSRGVRGGGQKFSARFSGEKPRRRHR